MNNGFQFFDIILFALVAVFILLRLRNTLGKRPDKDDKPDSGWSLGAPGDDGFGARGDAQRGDDERGARGDDDNVISLPGQDLDSRRPAPSIDEDLPVEIAGGVAEIRLADPQFEMAGFLEGAAFAYEMVQTSFAAENYETLRQLLADSVYDDFAAALRYREERGENLETILVAIDTVEPLEARMNGKMAEVTIKFSAEVVNVLRDVDGEILSGTPDLPDDVVDIWTFERDATSADPNWLIIATRKAN